MSKKDPKHDIAVSWGLSYPKTLPHFGDRAPPAPTPTPKPIGGK